jgi:hypothetical protein
MKLGRLLIALTSMTCALASHAMAEERSSSSRKLVTPSPFTGWREFNFAGGQGTQYIVFIDNHSQAKIFFAGVCSVKVAYQGPFRAKMAVGDGEFVKLTTHHAQLFKGKTAARNCRDNEGLCIVDVVDVINEVTDYRPPIEGSTGRCD